MIEIFYGQTQLITRQGFKNVTLRTIRKEVAHIYLEIKLLIISLIQIIYFVL
jgi:hypothetical protein